MTHSVLYVGDNTHIVELIDLRDHLGAVQLDASVSLTDLIDAKSGDDVAGVTLPLSMLHVADGLYRAILPYNITIAEGRKYYATIKAVGSQGFRGEWRETLIADVRNQ